MYGCSLLAPKATTRGSASGYMYAHGCIAYIIDAWPIRHAQHRLLALRTPPAISSVAADASIKSTNTERISSQQSCTQTAHRVTVQNTFTL